MKTSLFALLVVLSAPAWGGTWSPYFTIEHLQLHSNGGFLAKPADATALPGDCTVFRAYPNKHSLTTNSAKNALAAAMMAFAAGRKIRVYHDDSSGCYVRYLGMDIDE